MADTRQFCTFFLEHYFFGVDVRQVQEVFRSHEQTRVPLAPQVVSGLINLRGQIVTVIDLRRRLELRPRADAQRPMHVVVRHDDSVVDLLVDEIGDVVDVADDLFESPPGTLEGIARELIVGAYKLEGQLLLILDTEKAVDLERLNTHVHKSA
jgi:purine-binding chemotaxis protein CheW